MSTRILLMILSVALCAATAAAQSNRGTTSPADGKRNQRQAQPSPTPPADETADDGEVIRLETDLVTVPIRVLDRNGRFVAGLQRDNFKLFDEGIEQQIEHFSSEQAPFTVALVLDMSYSSKFKISEIQAAAIDFIEKLGPRDKVAVVSFDQNVHMLCRPTTDRRTIQRAIMSTRIDTGTSLYDAIDLVMTDVLRGVEGRKAVIVFTDGVDTTSSTASGVKNLDDALEFDALIYPISYDTFADVQRMKDNPVLTTPRPPGTSHPNTIPGKNPTILPFPTVGVPGGRGTNPEDYKAANEYLEQLARRTGGTVVPADSIGGLNSAFAKIASELREYYSIGFYPAENIDRRRARRLKVKVDRAGAVVRARDSYTPRKPVK
ncbi:MAG: VWA domain-containing protein [Pyrinomonadaceae bacterium]